MGTGLLSSAFPRREGVLWAGGVPLSRIHEEYGTPLYVYDAAVVRQRYDRLVDAFAGVELMLAYSVKANGNLALLDLLRRLDSGADIVSGGELFRVRAAGFDPERVVFAGVGKSEEELAEAIRWGIHGFHVESQAELETIDRLATRLGKRTPIGLRVNPDILSPTPHAYTRTGHAQAKFGIPAGDVVELYRWAASREHLWCRGIDVHIGSQIVSPDPHVQALDQVLEIVERLRAEGITLEYVDLGGGFGVRYADQSETMPVEALARRIVPSVSAAGLRLVLEPGRFLVGEAGVLLTRVLLVKHSGEKTFVVTDAGMTELIRPSHYGGEHEIEPVRENGAARRVVDVVGPICETGDFLARDRELALPVAGDVLAVRTAGAYGFVMSSNYNARLRPAEVVVDGERVELVRERERMVDLIRGERIPEWG